MQINYIVCSTQRSGSSLLCHLLRQLGNAGSPGEYLAAAEIDRSSVEKGRALIEKRRSDNGVSGIKIHYHQMRNLERRVPLDDIAPFDRYIMVHRENEIAQAISLAKAWQTQQWSTLRDAAAEPSYDAAEIDKALKRIRDDNAGWRQWLAARGAEPIVVNYRDLTERTESAIKQICDYLGIEFNGVDLNDVPIKKQSNAVNDEWERRYREDRNIAS